MLNYRTSKSKKQQVVQLINSRNTCFHRYDQIDQPEAKKVVNKHDKHDKHTDFDKCTSSKYYSPTKLLEQYSADQTFEFDKS